MNERWVARSCSVIFEVWTVEGDDEGGGVGGSTISGQSRMGW
jgi:hypothetical protein